MKKMNFDEKMDDELDLSAICDENKRLKSENDELKNLLNDWGNDAYNYSKMVIEQKKEIILLNNSIDVLSNENNDLKNNIRRLSSDNAKLSNAVEELLDENARLNKVIEEIFSSNSWKLTKPFRRLKNL